MAKRKLSQKNYEAIREHLFDRVHRTGEEVKNDFPNILRTAIETEAWKHFKDSEGKPFPNLVEWLHDASPTGIGMGAEANSITYEDALKLTEGHPEVHRALAKTAPKRKAGRKKKGAKIGASTPQLDRHGTTNTRPTLAAKLAQEHPKYYDAFMRGEYKSLTAAAIAAGLLKDDAHLRRAKSAYRKMTAAQRTEFANWLRTKEAKELPKKSKKKSK